MKQKDVALIIVIAFISAVVSFVVSDKVFVTAGNRAQQAAVVDPITASFQTPDKKYFNSSSIDPAQDAPIGSNNNQDPFNGGN